MKRDKEIIDIDEQVADDSRPQEIPTFSIEQIKDSPEVPAQMNVISEPVKRRRIWMWLCIVLAVLIIAACIGVFIQYDGYRGNRDLQASKSDKENLSLLNQSLEPGESGTVVTGDSVLGVAFDMCSLSGLRGSLEKEFPDTADRSVVLFMRSADYHPDGSIEGSFVMNGERLKTKSRIERRGYVALSSEGRTVIGISSSDDVAEKMEEDGGSFFRQFVLLGDGVLPHNFYLHGKVERSAIGRMVDGNLYYIRTRHKETMYDFADALREYGVVDAIYITGGNSYDFYRTRDGRTHISENIKEKMEKYKTDTLPAPLLVFRSRN